MKMYAIVFLLLAAQGLYASQDPNAVQDSLIARLDHLQNISADYHQTRIVALSPAQEQMKLQEKGEFVVILECGTLKFQNKFSFLEGRKRYDATVQFISENGQYHLPPGSNETMTFLEDHVEHLIQGNNPVPTGTIKKQSALPLTGGIEVGLGMRTYTVDRWITPEMIHDAEVQFDDAGNPIVIWVDDKGAFHEWTFSHRLGYAPISYRILNARTKNVMVEIAMSDFKPVDGLMLPYRMTINSRRSRTGEIFLEQHFEVAEYRLNDPENTPALYHIDWPQGTVVFDHRTGTRFIAEAEPEAQPSIAFNAQQKSARMTEKEKHKLTRSWWTIIILGCAAFAYYLFTRKKIA